MSYRNFFTKGRLRSLGVGLILFALSMVFQYYAGIYSVRHSSHFVSDIFLDNLPVINMNLVIINGALLIMLVSLVLVLSKPEYILFTLKALAVFIAVRSFFVVVTHLGIYPDQIIPGRTPLDRLYVALGLDTGHFFSGHTGLPFLMALIFWDRRFWRYFYFALSAIFGIAVLLAHVHYSIDVFAAPFMVYGIFKIAEYLFAEDYKFIQNVS